MVNVGGSIIADIVTRRSGKAMSGKEWWEPRKFPIVKTV